MANSITDNRTLVVNADSVTNWVGSTSPVLDTDVKVQGTGSIAEQITNTERWVMYNMGSTQNWANNVFYIWINCGVVGLLNSKASGGFKIRFAGPTTTDYFEFYVGGNDSWPTAVEGGWVQFVVDIQATPSNTGGTPPATSAIQHVGFAATTSAMTKVSDNTWIDEIRRLPDGSPGIIVEGRNGGTTAWNWSDLPTQLGSGAGIAKRGPGGTVILNTPVQFFVNDSTTHAFTDDTNSTVIWDNQEWAPSDLYGITVLGATAGTANFTLGVKTGSGDDAVGALGTTFLAAPTAVRWFWDSDAADIDACNLYGCTFVHGGDFQLDAASNHVISSTFIDCTSAYVSNAEILRCSVIDANTADGVAFMFTDDLTDIRLSNFQFSDGHAVGLLSGGPTTQTSKGNLFTGYGGTAGSNLTAGPSGSTDAAVANDNGSATVINVTTLGNSPSVYNETGTPSTTVNNNVQVTFAKMKDNSEVRVYKTSDDSVVDGIEDAIAGTTDNRTFAWTAPGGLSVYYVIHNFQETGIVYKTIRVEGYIVPSGDTTIDIQQQIERNVVP